MEQGALVDGQEKVIHVLTRTSGRPNAFSYCKASVDAQRVSLVEMGWALNHIVHCDRQRDLNYACGDLTMFCPPDSHGNGSCSPNLYLNRMHARVDRGWIMYLDDDDMFTKDDALARAMFHVEHKDQLILWRSKIGTRILPEPRFWGKKPKRCHIGSFQFAFHSSHMPLAVWDENSCSDFRVVDRLYRQSRPVWVDELLTRTQGRPGHRKRIDRVEGE